MKLPILILALSLVTSCAAPPDRPNSLWDDLPSAGESDAAKTVPSKVWDEAPSPDVSASDDGEGGEPTVVGTVVLNEIFYDSADSDTDGHLFIELYGTPGLSLGGFKIAFVNGTDGGVYDAITVPTGEVIQEDGFYLIADAKTGAPTVSNVAGADLIDNFDPQNGPDAVQLLDASGELLDAVGYGDEILPLAENGLPSFEGSSGPDVASGHSLERKTPGLDTNDNAADFIDLETPTPGGSHALPQPPEVTPEPLPAPEEPQELPPTPTKVVLNEIYYDAVGSDTDGVLFIELYGDPSLALEGYRVNFIDGADGSIDDSIILPSEARLPDDGFYVIADTKTGSEFETNVLGADFVDNFDPANGPDAVQLLDSQGGVIDVVGYGDGVVGSFEGTAAPDVLNGHSLERSSPGLDFDNNFDDFADREVPTPGS